jgi:hypothetical protein
MLFIAPAGLQGQAAAGLSDQDFWNLVVNTSEPDGTFVSQNLLSNELGAQWVIPGLLRTAKQGRAYLGVGPEQNFTYIATLQPSIAFIVDIRRGNLDVQLLYKALFDLSSDRVEFVSRLFGRRPTGTVTASASAADLFAAFNGAEPDQSLFDETRRAIDRDL